MKRIALLFVSIILAATGCEQDDFIDFPLGPGDEPGGQEAVTNLKDPGLAWSADSFEATIGGVNNYPSLTNPYSVDVTYASSKPDVATVSASGSITLLAAGSTLISASYAADATYSASSDSYLLTVLSASGSEPGDGSLSFASTGDPSSEDDISTTEFKGRITVTFSETGDATVSGDSYGYVSVQGNKVTVNNTGKGWP